VSPCCTVSWHGVFVYRCVFFLTLSGVQRRNVLHISFGYLVPRLGSRLGSRTRSNVCVCLCHCVLQAAMGVIKNTGTNEQKGSVAAALKQVQCIIGCVQVCPTDCFLQGQVGCQSKQQQECPLCCID
jgi:hypothetical protein